MKDMETRQGSTLMVDDLASASRSSRLRCLRALEEGLRRDGWVRIMIPSSLDELDRLYHESSQLFDDGITCTKIRRDALLAGDGHPLGLTFLGEGEEPLYDGRARQYVVSLNMHEHLQPSELESRTEAFDEEERELARRYHAWDTTDPAITPLRHAAAALRSRLVGSACGAVSQTLSNQVSATDPKHAAHTS